MSELGPGAAAILANRVYDVEDADSWERITRGRGAAGSVGLYGFDSDPRRLTGTTGGRFVGGATGFGFIAMGTGRHQGEALVALRGTASKADIITDVNCGFDHSPAGYVVHRGFSLTQRSVRQEIGSYFAEPGRNISTVHVIGHSLGGAVATITAEQLALAGHGVKLYTFGCPRVGDFRYAQFLTGLLGGENIHRVYHEADPVSMVPIFPFTPAPYGERAHCLPWKGFTVSGAAHLMGAYLESVGGCSWGSLPQAHLSDFFGGTEEWLNGIAAGSSRVKMFGAQALRMIMRALRWVLQQAATAGAALGQFIASGATMVIDALSYLLYTGYLASAKLASFVTALLQSMMQFTGRVLQKGMNITVDAVRYVLEWFVSSINPFVQQAIDETYGGISR
jgi:pimeloyl-ACP methyl ester carboxylesterase